MLEGVDFSAYLDSALLADVEVSIIIDDRPKPDAAVTTPRSRPAPAPAAITLPGHRLVLHAASPLFAGHIERCGAAGAPPCLRFELRLHQSV